MKQSYMNKSFLFGVVIIIFLGLTGKTESILAETIDSEERISVGEDYKNNIQESDGEIDLGSELEMNDSDPIDFIEEYASDRFNPDQGYPGPVLTDSKSGDSIMYGNPDLYKLMEGGAGNPNLGYRYISIVANHLLSRRVIENFLNDRLNSSYEHHLGYRKGDKVTIPLNMGFWSGNNIFSRPSGINFTGRTNIASGGFPGGGQPYFEQIVPSMSRDRVRINNGNDSSLMVDAWDIPKRPTAWQNQNLRLAYSTNSTQPGHASLVPIFSLRNSSDVTYISYRGDDFAVKFYADNNNSQWLEVERLNTNFTPNELLPFETPIGYYGRFNTFFSTYHGSGRYFWLSGTLSTEEGSFTGKGDVRTRKPSKLNVVQKNIPTYKLGQKITKEEVKKYISWSGNHTASEVDILGENIDHVITLDDFSGNTFDYLFKETLDGASREVTFKFEFRVDADLSIQTAKPDILLGTETNYINSNLFIEKVVFGGTELSIEHYNVELIDLPNTLKIGSTPARIKVSLKNNTNVNVVSDATANIVWGSTIVSKAQNMSDIDTAVSLLDKNGSPYLNANQGSGFSTNFPTILSRPKLSIYRNNYKNRILSASYNTIKNTPQQVADNWNGIFNKAILNYGDVMVYSVNKYGIAIENEIGKNTWISRDNNLTRETEGYNEAYYELTQNKYRLMRVNQFTMNDNLKVNVGIKEEDLYKKIIDIPSHINDLENFVFSYKKETGDNVGPQTGIIDISEKLLSGGEFSLNYPVKFEINSRITEKATEIDNEKNLLSKAVETNFEYGTTYTPKPKKYLSKEGELYVYKGYSDGENFYDEKLPEPIKNGVFNYEYKYVKADKYINVTIPTEIVFGTYENNKNIRSKPYEMKNNSTDLTTQVVLEKFEKVESNVELLGENDDEPTTEKRSAKLNLLVDSETIIKGINDKVAARVISVISPVESVFLELDGQYFGSKNETNIIAYTIKLKFKVIAGK